ACRVRGLDSLALADLSLVADDDLFGPVQGNLFASVPLHNLHLFAVVIKEVDWLAVGDAVLDEHDVAGSLAAIDGGSWEGQCVGDALQGEGYLPVHARLESAVLVLQVDLDLHGARLRLQDMADSANPALAVPARAAVHLHDGRSAGFHPPGLSFRDLQHDLDLVERGHGHQQTSLATRRVLHEIAFVHATIRDHAVEWGTDEGIIGQDLGAAEFVLCDPYQDLLHL